MKPDYFHCHILKKNYKPKIFIKKEMNNIQSKYIKFQVENFSEFLNFDILIIGHEILLVQLDKGIVYNCVTRKFLNNELAVKKQFSNFESKLSKFRKFIKDHLLKFKDVPILYFTNNKFRVVPNLKKLGFNNDILHKEMICKFIDDFYKLDTEPLGFSNVPEGVL
ncbi:MAG: hypothetical protein WC136_03765 [Sphaerochaeta sp.]